MLRILCLHGYRQTSAQFRGQTHALRKAVKKYGEVTYVQAPHSMINEKTGEPEDRYAWFLLDAERTKYTGADESIRFLSNFIEEHGPFDIILGFSQGACMAALCCSQYPLSVLGKSFSFKGAILVGGFNPRDTCLSQYMNSLEIPSLHVIGETDDIIPVERSMKLAELFETPVIVKHPGGHYVPSGSAFASHYTDFLSSFEI